MSNDNILLSFIACLSASAKKRVTIKSAVPWFPKLPGVALRAACDEDTVVMSCPRRLFAVSRCLTVML